MTITGVGDSSRTEFQLEGLSELVAKLEKINSDLVHDEVPAAMEAGAKLMYSRVLNNTPVKTGLLKKRTVIARSRSKRFGLAWRIWAKAPHSHLVERGHRHVKKVGFGVERVVGHVPPRPYMRPTFDTHGPGVRRYIEGRIRRRLSRV